MTPLPSPLERLLRAVGPSGWEHGRVDDGDGSGGVFAELAREFTEEVDVDVTGSVTATVRGSEPDGPLVAVYGHIDEIGLIVTHIDADGFLRFGPIGGWDPVNLMAQRVRLLTERGVVPGVIGRKTMQMMADGEQSQAPALTDLHIDVGADSREAAERLVSVGDVAVIDADPLPLDGQRVAARALDNRLGAYVALEAGRRLAAEGGHAATYLAVGNVQEEVTFAGARTSAYRSDPDLAVVVDATQATDSPGMKQAAEQTGHHVLGGGPVLQRGPTMHPTAVALMRAAADATGIPLAHEASGAETSTDADLIHIAGGGVATVVIAVPIRNMHSPVEIADLRDIEATAELVAEFVRQVPADLDTRRGRGYARAVASPGG